MKLNVVDKQILTNLLDVLPVGRLRGRYLAVYEYGTREFSIKQKLILAEADNIILSTQIEFYSSRDDLLQQIAEKQTELIYLRALMRCRND